MKQSNSLKKYEVTIYFENGSKYNDLKVKTEHVDKMSAISEVCFNNREKLSQMLFITAKGVK